MANEQNLTPFTSEQSREEAVKNGRKGGKKSGEVRRERKKFKEDMELLLSVDVKDPDMKKVLTAFGIDKKDMSNQKLLLVGLFKSAVNGNVQAFNKIQEMVEQKEQGNEKDSLAGAIQKAYENRLGDK